MTMRPMWCVSRRSSMWDHVLPPSVDLYRPSPQETLLRGLASPVPTQTTAGLDGATAMAPMLAFGRPGKTHDHDRPSSGVFHTPPAAAPTYWTAGRDSTTATAGIRPGRSPGPMPRAT